MGFFRWLWSVSGTAWKYSATQNRWAGNYGTLWTFVFLLFFIFFAVAWIFGYPPSAVTAWLNGHAAIWLWIAGALWRIFWGSALLLCAIMLFAIWEEWFGKRAEGYEDQPRDIKTGCGCLAIMPLVVYVAWIGMTMSLD